METKTGEIPQPPQRVKYDLKFPQEVDVYIEDCKKNKQTPTVAGFAQRIGTDEQSVWAWANKKRKDEEGILTDQFARPQFREKINELQKLSKSQPVSTKEEVKEDEPEKKAKTKNYSAKEIKEKKEKFLEYFKQLPIQKLGAEFIGVNEDTITDWKKSDSDFSDQVDSAKSEWALNNVKKVRSKEWLLERLLNDHFGEKKTLDIEGGLTIKLVNYESAR